MKVYIKKVEFYEVEVEDQPARDARQEVEWGMGDEPQWYLDNEAEPIDPSLEIMLRADGEIGWTPAEL